jgi:uncharacterized protein (TIGR02271 family)
MTQVLVGVFDSFEQADQAITHLTQAGIARSEMEIHATERGSEEPTSGVATEQAVEHENEGMGSKIGRFFGNLFGGDEQPAEVGHYQEAVRRGGAVLTVTVLDETNVRTVFSALHDAGAIDIDERATQWQNTGYKGYDPSAAQYSADEIAAERQSFAVVRESLDVGKREVNTGGVRVYSVGTERPVSESVTLREEHATIERNPVDRIATAEDLTGGSVEVRETAEHAVVAKAAHVIEEVVVGKEATEREEMINETLRGTEVKVERTQGEREPGTVASAASLSPADPAAKRP